MISCPSDLELRMLAEDGLESARFDSIDGHTRNCPACRARLESLAWEIPAPAAGGLSDLPEAGDFPSIPGFTIEKELGRGAMGVVYLAWQESVQRYVALKVIPAVPGADRRARKRWRNEAKAVSCVRHPNAVTLYNVGEVDSWLYLVLEYIPGQSLAKRLLLGPVGPRDAARLMAAIADAVHHIHQSGLLHLDLKPSNILLDGDPQVAWDKLTPKVADFGLAVFDGNRDSAATTMAGPRGTPSYMAPEQADTTRAPLDAGADLHALGAVLYELLTGRPPFQGASPLDTLDQVRSQEPVPPRRLNPRIPRDQETITLKCLQKSPERRYLSAEALAADLRRWLDGKPIAARPVSPTEHAWRSCRRRPAVAALAAALLLAITGGLLGMSVLWSRAEIERQRAEGERSQAQAAKARAERDSRTAIGLVGELIELSAGGHEGTPRVLGLEDTAGLLLRTRRNFLGLAPRDPDAERFLKQLGSLDGRLISVLLDLHRHDELETLLIETIRECQAAVRRHPQSTEAWACQIGHHDLLAGIAAKRGDAEDAEAHVRKAIACAEEWLRTDRGAGPLESLVKCRRHLASFLASSCRQAEARELLLANHHSLWRFTHEVVDEKITAERVIGYIEFRYLNLGELPPPAAEETGRLELGAAVASAASDRSPATAWASAVVASLRCASPSRTSKFRETVAAREITYRLCDIAADQRHSDQLDRARQTVERMLAFARLVVERNPNDPAAYLMLADAFCQAQKNAWRPTKDHPAVELNLRRAIEATQHALDLAPFDESARVQLERLRRKLHGFLHPS
jgi:tetratricopeptide (TPR) repeat protein